MFAISPARHRGQLLDGGPSEDGDLTIVSAAGAYLVRTWTLTLGTQYDGPAWRIALMRRRAVVHAPTEPLLRNFTLLAALLTLGIAWVTVAQVRRLLRPLDALTAATGRLARRGSIRPSTSHQVMSSNRSPAPSTIWQVS